MPCWTEARISLYGTGMAGPLSPCKCTIEMSNRWHACCKTRASEVLSIFMITKAGQLSMLPACTMAVYILLSASSYKLVPILPSLVMED